MNAMPLRFLVCTVLLLGLCACASTGSRLPPGPNQSTSTQQLDTERIAYVESVARRRGVLVQWVNPPTIRRDRSD